jgi:TPP-dependent 2-oxoacid decarboxylase
MPAFTISRLGLQQQAQKAIEAIGCPFATTLMEKCLIDESHPQFAGMYAGAASDPKTRQIVEEADLVLDLGGINLNDITTATSISSTYLALLPSVSTTSGSETMSLPACGWRTCWRNCPS